jgi:hypothetical protein
VTKRIVFPREVLLVEVERRCGEPMCGARVRISLTKAQARSYTGFECGRCARWFADALSEQDIPEWWEELNVTLLEGLKPPRESAGEHAGSARNASPVLNKESKPAPELSRASEDKDEDEEDEAEVVARMSREWRRLGGEREVAPEAAEEERGGSF